jgi:CTP-dependent riboflavin kinase
VKKKKKNNKKKWNTMGRVVSGFLEGNFHVSISQGCWAVEGIF